ncbi:MAG: hypothetical protein ACRDPB_10185 [Nocardioidaceae bacterium]
MGKFVLVVIVIAALVYAGVWLLERRRTAGPRPPRNQSAPPRTKAPDDDEDFLRGLRRPRSDDGGSDHPS